ncbi:MAG: helix-turn-helix domain-containing protein [Nannocystaceae bacterium]
MADDRLIEVLGAVGFKLNEARAYVALLRAGPSTGYEVSRDAGVPRSAVYSVLRGLVLQGVARRDAGPPERFSATPPKALEGLLRRRFDGATTALREAIARLDVSPDAPDAFTVAGYDRIVDEATRIVAGARRRLVLSGWPRELAKLAPALAAAQRRGVFVVLFSHARLPEDLAGLHFGYGLREGDLEAFWAHRLVVVADDRQSLLGATENSRSDRAVVSETAAIAEIAVSQIALDITLLAQRHGVDVTGVMAQMLGDRVGRLDTLLAAEPTPQLGMGPLAPGARAAGRRPRRPSNRAR